MSTARCTPRSPPGHQPVQVGPADQAQVGAHRHGGHDVRAGQDAGVQPHLGVVPDLVDDLRQQLDRRRRAVELPTAVIGQQHRVGPVCDDVTGVVDVLDALHHELAGPHFADPVQVVEIQRRVEHGVDELLDRAAPRGERREGQWLGREQVEPPSRVQGTFEEGAQRQRGRDGQAVAHVPHPRAADGRVDGEHDGVIAGRVCPLQQLTARALVAPDVQLEPLARVRCCRREVLDGCGAHG
jgi:hypothetical protein